MADSKDPTPKTTQESSNQNKQSTNEVKDTKQEPKKKSWADITDEEEND